MSNDTAAHFDRVFGDKGEDTYVFDDAGLGPKDRRLAAPRCLRSLVDSLLFRFIVNK